MISLYTRQLPPAVTSVPPSVDGTGNDPSGGAAFDKVMEQTDSGTQSYTGGPTLPPVTMNPGSDPSGGDVTDASGGTTGDASGGNGGSAGSDGQVIVGGPSLPPAFLTRFFIDSLPPVIAPTSRA